MRGRFENAASLTKDGFSAVHSGLAFGRSQYRDNRRVRGESLLFQAAYETASSIGGWLRRGEAEALFELASGVTLGEDIVEVGSYLGRSTAFLALGANRGRTIHSVDPHTGDRSQVEQGLEGIDTSKQFLRNMKAIGVEERIQAHVMTSLDAARRYRGRPVGLLFIDGWHTEEAVFEDGTEWSAHFGSDVVVAFDDIADLEVSRGVQRLIDNGIVNEIAGRVGKVGLCGPKTRWPKRLIDITTTR